MAKERLKEKIANLRNVQTHLWTAMLVTISGSLTLLQSFDTILNKILCIAGFLLFFFLLDAYLSKNKYLKELIQKVEDS